MMWWWNDYWPMHWVLGPLMMLLLIVFCGVVMFFMMRSPRANRCLRMPSASDLPPWSPVQAQYEEQRRLLEA